MRETKLVHLDLIGSQAGQTIHRFGQGAPPCQQAAVNFLQQTPSVTTAKSGAIRKLRALTIASLGVS